MIIWSEEANDWHEDCITSKCPAKLDPAYKAVEEKYRQKLRMNKIAERRYLAGLQLAAANLLRKD